jgi:hypothetical protein
VDAVLALSPSMITCTVTGFRTDRSRSKPAGIDKIARTRP